MTDLLAEVNERVRELADQRPHGSDAWDFQCECGEPECQDVVSLTLPEYELIRRSGTPILAEGHVPSRFRLARDRATELRNEAIALRRQARHQAERARRVRDADERGESH